MKRKDFFKYLAGFLLIPFVPKITKAKEIDIYSFVGWLTTKDGRPIYVNNIANGGWGIASWRNASFIAMGLRRDLCRINCGEQELQRMEDICEACCLNKIYHYDI